jgi:hypothetical protein
MFDLMKKLLAEEHDTHCPLQERVDDGTPRRVVKMQHRVAKAALKAKASIGSPTRQHHVRRYNRLSTLMKKRSVGEAVLRPITPDEFLALLRR